MEAKQEIITRLLPKTGQIISYDFYDDGAFEVGWWKGRLNANNKTRFISKTIAGDDVVIDRATGLMWAADGDEAGCGGGVTCLWGSGDGDCLSLADELDFAGFTDWRVPNIKELMSILDFSLVNPTIDETFFPNTKGGNYWSSTTYVDNTLLAWVVFFVTGEVNAIGKSIPTNRYLRCVRGGI